MSRRNETGPVCSPSILINPPRSGPKRFEVSSPALLVAAILLAGCVEERPLVERTASFDVQVAADLGTPDEPLPFPDEPIEVDVTVRALSNRGGVREGFSGPVALFVQPGDISGAGMGPVTVELESGTGGARVWLERVYGPTHVCAEDRLGREPSYAVGCSDRFHFEMPSVAQLQITDNNAESPMEGAYVDIRAGDLIVTGVYPEGFFLTDLAAEPVPERPGDFGSIFIFNFSYPEGISIGDRLSSVSGTVQVFVGSTQLVFPSWVHREGPRGGHDDLPEPVEMTAEICDAATSGTTAGLCGHSTSNLDIESLESALVTVRGARTPTRWVDCDFNRDGHVANWDPRCHQHPIDPSLETYCAEIECNTECNLDKECTELSSYRQYGQWAVTLDGGAGPKINIVTREGYPELDPLASKNKGVLIDVTGNLRHSLPARPRWLVLARDSTDVTVHRPD